LSRTRSSCCKQLSLLLLEALPSNFQLLAVVVVVSTAAAVAVALIAVAGNVVIAGVLQVMLQLNLPPVKRASVRPIAKKLGGRRRRRGCGRWTRQRRRLTSLKFRLQDEGDDPFMTFRPRNIQRCAPIAVGDRTVRALVEQDGHDVRVAVEGGQLERGPALVVRVNMDAVLQQGADGVRLAVAHRQV
jgi:hypothetical protein